MTCNRLFQICLACLAPAVPTNALRLQFSERDSMVHKNEDIHSCASFTETSRISKHEEAQRRALRKAIGALTEVKADYWLAAGTLLGLHRSCSFLNNTDIDIAIDNKWWLQNSKEATNTIEKAMLGRGFKVYTRFENTSEFFGHEISWMLGGMRVDFFSAPKLHDNSRTSDPAVSGAIEEYKRIGKFSNNEEINRFFGRLHLGKAPEQFPASWQQGLWVISKSIQVDRSKWRDDGRSVLVGTMRGVRKIVNFNWKQITGGQVFSVRIPDPSDGLQKIEASTKELVAKPLDSRAGSTSEVSKYSSLVNTLVSYYGLDFQKPEKWHWYKSPLKVGSTMVLTASGASVSIHVPSFHPLFIVLFIVLG